MKVTTYLKIAWDGTVLAEESFEYSGAAVLCKGASAEEKANAQAQADLAHTLQQDFATTFANQQNILAGLSKQLSPIVNAGPSQFGYSTAQTNALNTLASSGTAQQYQNAKRAVGEAQAAAGGGNALLPTGTNQQTMADLASAGAQQESNELLSIQNAGWNQGNQNYNRAVSDLLSTSGQFNPTGYASEAGSANSSAFNMSKTIADQNNAASPWNAIGGALGGIAGLVGAPILGDIGSKIGSKITGSLFGGGSNSGAAPGDIWTQG